MPSIMMIKIGLILFGLMAATAVGAGTMHKIDLVDYAKLELKVKTAEADAERKKAENQTALDQAGRDVDAANQAKLDALRVASEARAKVIVKRVVSGRNNCVTWGLVRYIDSQVDLVGMDDLQVPAGVTDSTCINYPAARLAQGVGQIVAVGQRNTARAAALQDYVNRIAKVK